MAMGQSIIFSVKHLSLGTVSNLTSVAGSRPLTSQFAASRPTSNQVSKMIALLSVLLLILQAVASDKTEKFSGERSDLLQNEESKHHHQNLNSEPKHQLEKDYERWDEKKYNFDEHNKNFMKMNEIDDNEFVDKFNKNGKVFNPEQVDKSFKKRKEFIQGKKSEHDNYESKSLFHDIDVNYIKNNKKIEKESELIPEGTQGFHKNMRNYQGDTNINYNQNKKKIERDSDLIPRDTPSSQKTMENYQENFQNKNEMFLKRYKKNFYHNLKKLDLSQPPFNDAVLMARYIVHSADSAALATLSGQNPTKAAPFVCAKAFSDGIANSSSGIPFFYISPKDLCTQNLQKKNRVSVLISFSDTKYCKERNCDQEDHKFTKVTLSGEIKRIKPGGDEESFAKNALFSRHPRMANWPADHQWYFTKLKIGQIVLLDQFGGATYVNLKDYLNGGKTEPEK